MTTNANDGSPSIEERLEALEHDMGVLEGMVRILHATIGGVGCGLVEALSEADAAVIAKVRVAAAEVRSLRCCDTEDGLRKDIEAGWRAAGDTLEFIAKTHEQGLAEKGLTGSGAGRPQ